MHKSKQLTSQKPSPFLYLVSLSALCIFGILSAATKTGEYRANTCNFQLTKINHFRRNTAPEKFDMDNK
jgi:hypothetical protein